VRRDLKNDLVDFCAIASRVIHDHLAVYGVCGSR